MLKFIMIMFTICVGFAVFAIGKSIERVLAGYRPHESVIVTGGSMILLMLIYIMGLFITYLG